ncbi:MAG: fold [Pseudonocardia sp.]
MAAAARWALATGHAHATNHRIVRPDRAIRWLYSAGRIVTGEDGVPQRMQGLTWDVTDRWQSPTARWYAATRWWRATRVRFNSIG